MDIIINLFHPCTFPLPSTHILLTVKCHCSVLAYSITLIFSFLIIIIIIMAWDVTVVSTLVDSYASVAVRGAGEVAELAATKKCENQPSANLYVKVPKF